MNYSWILSKLSVWLNFSMKISISFLQGTSTRAHYDLIHLTLSKFIITLNKYINQSDEFYLRKMEVMSEHYTHASAHTHTLCIR